MQGNEVKTNKSSNTEAFEKLGIGEFIKQHCKIVQEPDYAKSQLKFYQEKYNISDKDMQHIIYNTIIIRECKDNI